jgi:hypothetical protein
MGTASTPSLLRGILVPDPRFRWSTSGATATSEAGPEAGVPEPQQTAGMALEASGVQEDTGLRVRTIQAGNPSTDDAKFVWRYQGDTSWRGWDPPCSLTGFEFIDRSTTVEKWKSPHAVTLGNGTVLVAAVEDNQKVVVFSRDPDTGVGTSVVLYDNGSAFTYGAFPTLVPVDSGRVLCFFWKEYSGYNQVRMHYSEDSGATWDVGQRACLADGIDVSLYEPKRMRGAHLNGQVVLILHLQELATPQDQLHQYASLSIGATFGFVSSLTGINRGYPDVIVSAGNIYVGYISDDPTTGSTIPPKWRRLGTASADIAYADSGVCQTDADPMQWGTLAGGVFSTGGLAMWADDDGSLWVAGVDQGSATQEVLTRVSTDGETWSDVGSGPSTAFGLSVWRGQDADTGPKPDLAVVAQRGRALMIHRFRASPGNAGDSLCCAYLGGYTTLCMPQEDEDAPDVLTMVGWAVTWLPYDLPEDVGDAVPVWVHTSTGTAVLGSDGLHLTTTLGQTELFATDLALPDVAGTLAQGLMAQGECKVVSGTCRMELRISDATPLEYEVFANVTPTSISLYDVNASADVASVATTAAATGYVQLILQLTGDRAKLWYRSVGAGSSRDFILVGSSTTLRSAAFNTGNRVRWGQTTLASESYWRMVCFSGGTWIDSGLLSQTNPNDLFGRSFGKDIYVDGGVEITAIDGPTFRGDYWNINADYNFPVSNLFPDTEPSPRAPWRSTSSSVDLAIEWTVGEDATLAMGPLMGLYLGECNFGRAEFWGKNAANTWVKICDLNLSMGSSLHWRRNDRMIRPATGAGGSVDFYLPTNILAGSHIYLDGGNVRKIETNSAGTWTGSGTSLQTRILLEEVDGTEGPNGTTGQIWSKDYAGVVPVTTAYKAFKLVIPAQATSEGYLTIGSLLWGHVFPLGGYLMGTGWGRAMEWAYAFEQVEGRTGIRIIHDQGPTRRAAEMAWVDGVETSGLLDANPNWIVGWTTSGDPVAVPADMPYSMPGLIDSLRGATLPVAYLPCFNLPATTGSVVEITDRRLLLYGNIMTESLRADNVVGEEGRTEILRLGTCRLEELT